MRTRAIVLFGLLIVTGSQAADVWKCKIGESVVFSDVPCPSSGKQMESRDLQGNVIQAERQDQHGPVRAGSTGGDGTAIQSRATYARAAPAENVCPSDLEIRNMETKLSSVTIGPKERAFVADEIRRARQCRKGQGTYSAGDWRVSRDAQDAQNNISGGSSERLRAEGMHSAADPIEGDRIDRRRTQEESDRRLAEAIREGQAKADAAWRFRNCDARGCWIVGGDYYKRTQNAGLFFGPRGFCRQVGDRLQCP